MKDLLNDKETYKKLNKDPRNKIQTNVNNLISFWEKKLYISENTSKKLKIHNALPPRIYGLPKLHKPNIPLRPIVSSIQSPTYIFSKFLADIY